MTSVRTLVGALVLSAGVVSCVALSAAGAAPVTPVASAPESKAFAQITVAEGLEHPWGLAFLPDGSMLVTEREGRVRIVRDGALASEPVARIQGVLPHGQGGLMDISLHPKFAENKWVYLTYTAGTRSANHTVMARGTFDGSKLNDVQVIFSVGQLKSGGQHFGSRILWLPDGTMLLAIGDGGNPPVTIEGGFIRLQAQNTRSHLGKTLRLDENGKAPADNPFADGTQGDPVVWSYGHRNIQGMAIDPESGRVWATEHGARGGDELNVIKPKVNYGWPLATFSKEYWGPDISDTTHRDGMEDAKAVWTPAIAPSGLAFYTGDKFPALKGALLAGGLVTREIRIVYLDGDTATRQESIRIGDRVRDVRQGPDGFIYVLTDERRGRLIRLEPAK